MNPVDGVAGARPGCDNRGKPGLNIVGFGSFATKSGRRQRYRCTVCRGTISTNTGTAYRGLRCTRREFEQVASLRGEGVSRSATARVTGHSRNTVARWLERASTAATRFSDRKVRGFDLVERQADELRTLVGNKNKTVWLFVTIEVSSRVWAGSILGRRSDHNARAVITDAAAGAESLDVPSSPPTASSTTSGRLGTSLGQRASMARYSRRGETIVSSGSSAACRSARRVDCRPRCGCRRSQRP